MLGEGVRRAPPTLDVGGELVVGRALEKPPALQA